jgi:hypothetical protein
MAVLMTLTEQIRLPTLRFSSGISDGACAQLFELSNRLDAKTVPNSDHWGNAMNSLSGRGGTRSELAASILHT